MTQSIMVQVGQCGNQIGCRFWDLCLREHSFHDQKGIYNDSVSSFFRNTDSRFDSGADIPVGQGKSKISNLKARAILVDMEEGVINEMLQTRLGSIFDHKQLITDVSGSGNNWAVGNKEYGTLYKDQIIEQVRKAAEACDCLQCFFIVHSMGGGTGSGLGTAILALLKDEYPEVYRFVTAVYPSQDDDVITSPYNSVLAMRQLTEYADCVLPIDNQSLVNIYDKVSQAQSTNKFSSDRSVKVDSLVTSNKGCLEQKKEKPFDSMNNIVANTILNMTSSSRFEGSLNVDLNEIAMNLVPFPKMHYLISSVAPLYISKDVGLPPRRLDQAFGDLFTKDHQLVTADPARSLYLACALMVRGSDVSVSDLRRNIDKLKANLNFVPWNMEGWKTGLCNFPPVGQPYSLLCLSNNTCVQHAFRNLRERFSKLYKRKAHVHHYERVDGFDLSLFDEGRESLNSVIAEYQEMENIVFKSQDGVSNVPRLKLL
uniref:tubulin epsilon chain-like n=1 Tax=Styela clava TaxID=7725 RepID=UPI00193A4C28|nr:tubulin epsilon chain-like [Styela clava]